MELGTWKHLRRAPGACKRLGAVAAAACLTPLTAAAQSSSVEIYGLIDSGVEVTTNNGATKKRSVHMPTLTGSLPSRLGFRGSEDLGGGLRAIYVLESGFSPASGGLNQNGRGFGRQSWVGLAGPWGQFTAGRQYSRFFYELIGDVFGPNVFAAGILDPYLPNPRLDNTVAYTGTFGPVTIGGVYSFARDSVAPAAAGGCAEQPADSKACRDLSTSVRYTATNWAASVVYERMWGGAGPTSPLPLSSQTDTRTSFSGYYKFGGPWIGGGFLRRKNEGSTTRPKSDYWYIGADYPMGSWDFTAQYGHISFDDTPNSASIIAARAMYFFSKRTAVYATAGKVTNKGVLNFSIDGGSVPGSGFNPPAGVGQTGFMVGLRHSF